MSLAQTTLVIVSMVWMIRAVSSRVWLHGIGTWKPSWRDALLGGAVAGLLWLNYVRTIDPSVRWPTDILIATHTIQAANSTIAMPQYIEFLLLVAAVAVSFVFTGYFVCRVTGFLVRPFAAVDMGVSYFVGMAAFLSLDVGAAVLSRRARASAVTIVILFAAVSAYTMRRWVDWHGVKAWMASRGRVMLWGAPFIVGALCLLHFVVATRAGLTYDEFAQQIAVSDRLPLFERHFGQSLLASVGLMAFGTGETPFAFAKILINDWLYASQIAFVFLLFRFLSDLSVSRMGAVAGVFILMLGNSALSLLPYIMYDHDYPLMLNIYADSIFGIAASLIIVAYLFQHRQPKNVIARDRSWADAGFVVPALFMFAFNYTAELDAVIVFVVFGVLAAVNARARTWPWARLATLVAVCAIATLVGAGGGGLFSTRISGESGPRTSSAAARQASGAQITLVEPRWWYLPYKIVGLETGYGNLPEPNLLLRARNADPYLEKIASYSQSTNESLIGAFDRDRTWAAYEHLVYLAELRVGRLVQALWFPLSGVVGLGVLLRTRLADPGSGDADIETLRLFWLITATVFGGSVAFVFFANTAGGNAVFWKWALTRLLEPGLCLATIAIVVALDRVTLAFETPRRRYLTLLAVALVMSCGPLYRILCFDLRA